MAILLLLAAKVAAAPPTIVNEAALFHLPGSPGGSAVLSDNSTLVVSIPEETALLYFNTDANKQTKRVEVDFKPGIIAVRGDVLYVAGAGTSIVHVLDAASGKEKTSYKIGAGVIARLACHPKSGPLFASTNDYRIYSIDTDSGTATKTIGLGYHLAVDPVDGKTLYSGIQPPIDDDVVFRFGPNGEMRVFWDSWGRRAVMLSYTIKENGLKVAAVQDNAAVNGYSLHLSPDGKKIMMPGGGGWRSKNGKEGGYHTAIFDADGLKSVVGEAPHAVSLAFHPILNLGVANVMGRDLTLFNAKSMKWRQTVHIAPGAGDSPLILHFAAYGSKVVLFNGDNPKNPVEGLHFIPLDLQKEEWASLAKAYAFKVPVARKGPAVINEFARETTTTPSSLKKKSGGGSSVKVTPVAKKAPPKLVELLDKNANFKLAYAEANADVFSDRGYFLAKLPKEMTGGVIVQRSAEGSKAWIEDGKVKVLKDCTMYAVIRRDFNKQQLFTQQQFNYLKTIGWKEVEGELDVPGPPGEEWLWRAMKKPVKAGDEAFPLKNMTWPAQRPIVVFVFK